MAKVIEYYGFEGALHALKTGFSVSRVGWNGKGLYVTMQVPDENSKMSRPYLYLTSPVGSTHQFSEDKNAELNRVEHRVPWLASQTDLLADDWFVLNKTTEK